VSASVLLYLISCVVVSGGVLLWPPGSANAWPHLWHGWAIDPWGVAGETGPRGPETNAFSLIRTSAFAPPCHRRFPGADSARNSGRTALTRI